MESYSSDSSYTTYVSDGSSSISDASPQHYHNANRATNVKCRYFMNSGYCFYGDACQFLHAASSLTSNGTAPRAKQDNYYSSEGEKFICF